MELCVTRKVGTLHLFSIFITKINMKVPEIWHKKTWKKLEFRTKNLEKTWWEPCYYKCMSIIFGGWPISYFWLCWLPDTNIKRHGWYRSAVSPASGADSHNSQFEIAFSTSTRCLCLCVFILSPGRQAMLLQCANMYNRTGHSNTKYNMKYNCFGLGSLRDTFYRFAKVSHGLTTQLSIVITGLLTSNFTSNI